MSGECYFCNGIVFPSEPDDILLDGHADHAVYMHRRCAEGYNALESVDGTGDGDGDDDGGTRPVVCPECDAVEHVAFGPPASSRRASDSSHG
jgi:hypothetical protein